MERILNMKAQHAASATPPPVAAIEVQQKPQEQYPQQAPEATAAKAYIQGLSEAQEVQQGLARELKRVKTVTDDHCRGASVEEGDAKARQAAATADSSPCEKRVEQVPGQPQTEDETVKPTSNNLESSMARVPRLRMPPVDKEPPVSAAVTEPEPEGCVSLIRRDREMRSRERGNCNQ